MATKFYQLDDTEPEANLYIFGNITSDRLGVADRSAYDIVKELNDVTAPAINVHINSYGGEVSEGLAIYNALRESGKTVTTICDGFACSAASVVFMAGDVRIMRPASLLMIHNAWTYADGNAAELRKQADALDTITSASIEAYKAVAKISEEEIKQLMDAESWISPADAIKYGFATDISEETADGPQQSAFGAIMQKLTAPEAETFDVDKATDAVVNLLSDKLSDWLEKAAKQKAKDIEPMPKLTNTWDTFFKKGN